MAKVVVGAREDITVESFLDDVSRSPGYYHLSRWKFWRALDKGEQGEQFRKAREIVDQCINDGLITVGFNGHFYPNTVQPLTIFQCIGMWWIYYGFVPKLVLGAMVIIAIQCAAGLLVGPTMAMCGLIGLVIMPASFALSLLVGAGAYHWARN